MSTIQPSNDLRALKLGELQSLAHEYNLPDVDKLSKSTLLQHLEALHGYETQTLSALRESAREKGITEAAGLNKRELAWLIHRYDMLAARTAEELRRSAESMEIPGAKRLKKRDLVVACLEHEFASISQKNAVSAGQLDPLSIGAESWPTAPSIRSFRAARWLGVLLKASSTLFIFITTLALVLMPLFFIRSLEPAQSLLTAVQSSTTKALVLIDSLSLALENTGVVIESSADSLISVSQVLADSRPLIDSTGVLLGSALPDSIVAAQEGLLQAEDSARALDQLLRGLATFGLITGVRYDPEVPLHEGIADTAEGLDPLPDALIEVRDQVVTATDDLDMLIRNLRSTANAMRTLNVDIQGQERQLEGLQQTIKQLDRNLEGIEQDLPITFLLVGLVTELLLFGLLATQIAVFVVGQSIMKEDRQAS
jgi:hypothetical protein